MASKVTPGPVTSGDCIREAVCVHTNKIYDSCKDKDCLEDLRFYPTADSQPIIASACSVRSRTAELLFVNCTVSPLSFNRGYYAVDTAYYYRVTGDAYGSAVGRPTVITGLCVFEKRVILFGSEGSAKVFSSDFNANAIMPGYMPSVSSPTAYVEAVDPIILDMKLVDIKPYTPSECELQEIPEAILASFESPIVTDTGPRRVYVSLGQFSIVRIERDSQLLIPTYDYCLPDKECAGSDSGGDPCALFSQVSFPMDEFFPPDALTQ